MCNLNDELSFMLRNFNTLSALIFITIAKSVRGPSSVHKKAVIKKAILKKLYDKLYFD